MTLVLCLRLHAGKLALSPSHAGTHGEDYGSLREICFPNHFYLGGADCGPLRERGPFLQGPAAGWRGFCQLVVQVGIEVFAFAGESGECR